MKIVIDISDDTYKAVCNGCMLPPDVENVVNAIKNGTPLPERHGRLVDADKLIRDTIKNPVHAPYIHIIDMKEAPTIIEGSDAE